MPVQLGAKPQADFSHPVGLLTDCHRRIENFLQILLRVVRERQGDQLDRQHREALEAALTYFRSAAPRHTQDEEGSLFPRMRQCHDPEVGVAMAMLDALEADHRAADAHHDRVDELGAKWLSEQTLDDGDVSELAQLLNALIEIYREHIRVEDEEIFPLAAKCLTPEELAEIGQEMKLRRST